MKFYQLSDHFLPKGFQVFQFNVPYAKIVMKICYIFCGIVIKSRKFGILSVPGGRYLEIESWLTEFSCMLFYHAR